MPGPEGPAHRGKLGIVTGIRGVLVFVNEQLAKHGEECKFCFAVEDSKAKKAFSFRGSW